MMFFMTFCDNNINVIETMNDQTQNRIEILEHNINIIRSELDVFNVKNELSSLISLMCQTKRTDTQFLTFIGGLTVIKDNMRWHNGMKQFADINDDNVLV